MALLDIFKSSSHSDNEAVEAAEFQNVVIYSDNVAKDLQNVALKQNINPKLLDFKILAYKTLYRKKGAPKYQELTPLEQERFFSVENLTNPNIEISQKIKIEIFKRQKGKKLPFKISLGANKTLTKVVLKVPAQDGIEYSDTLYGDLMAQIDTRKARLGILIGFMRENSKSQLRALISDIQVNGKISKDYTIPVCEGYEPIHQNNGEIILHYMNKEKQNQSEKRVDHSERDFMHTVCMNDLVIEVLKSKEGRAGRDCKSNIIPFQKLDLSQNLDIVVSEDFRVEEKENVIYYYANKSGFIYSEKENHFEIRDELVVNEVSFRSTGSIDASGEEDIKINIEGKDSLSDAIGQGVRVVSSEVKTAGNMGSGAEVIADKVEIGGQTHQSSKIVAKEVDINLHKGEVEGDVVRIGTLENGRVEANTVYVDKVSGGEIIAKDVYLKEVLSNTTIYASHYIEIDLLNGNGNKFIIDPKSQKDFKQKVENAEEKIKSKKENIKELSKKIKLLRRKIQNDKDNIKQINETIIDLKRRQTTVPTSLINKLKDNQANIKEHNLLLKELKDDKMQLESFEADLKELVNAVFDAKVVNRSVWKEFNEVKFKVVEPPVEVSHLFTDGEMSEVITIKSMEDGKYILERKKG